MGRLHGLAGAFNHHDHDYAIILFMIMNQKNHQDPQQGQSSSIEDLSQGIHRGRGQRNGSLACCASRKKVFFIFFAIFFVEIFICLNNNLSALMKVMHFLSGVSRTNN